MPNSKRLEAVFDALRKGKCDDDERQGLMESAIARSSSSVYLLRTGFSIDSKNTVRIASMASEAMEALCEKHLAILTSIADSSHAAGQVLRPGHL